MISVVIATRNRAEILRIALESLAQQTASTADFEVIVVDDYSVDHTRDVVHIFEQHGNVHYLKEARSGNSHARNTGWQAAVGEYIAFVDDDCKMPSEWITHLQAIITERHPIAFGGPYYPFYITEKPAWFQDRYMTAMHIDYTGILPDDVYMSGGHMIFHKSALVAVDGFSPDWGIDGKKRIDGEDIKLQIDMRQQILDFKIYYDVELFVYHLVKPQYMRLSNLVSHRFQIGRRTNELFQNNRFDLTPAWRFALRSLKVVLTSGYRLIVDTVYGLFFRDRESYPYFQNVVYERHLHQIMVLGAQYEMWIQYWRQS